MKFLKVFSFILAVSVSLSALAQNARVIPVGAGGIGHVAMVSNTGNSDFYCVLYEENSGKSQTNDFRLAYDPSTKTYIGLGQGVMYPNIHYKVDIKDSTEKYTPALVGEVKVFDSVSNTGSLGIGYFERSASNGGEVKANFIKLVETSSGVFSQQLVRVYCDSTFNN